MANETKIAAESGKQEIVITREFDAPPGPGFCCSAACFKAWCVQEVGSMISNPIV